MSRGTVRPARHRRPPARAARRNPDACPPGWRPGVGRYVMGARLRRLRNLVALGAAAALALTFAAAPPAAWPAPTAHVQAATTTHTVGYDHYSLTIDGQRVYLWGAEFHYWRLPSPGLWRDVLQKLKAGGFN